MKLRKSSTAKRISKKFHFGFLVLVGLFQLMEVHASAVFSPYGFIKVSMIGSDRALQSYSYINLSAPTGAAARTRGQDSLSRFSFQAAQSRLGFTVSESDRLEARIETDFIDFAKSSPTVQMIPRIRRLAISYKTDGGQIVFGQDWDLFSPTNPFTFDIVGLYFNAGNAGFQRQQLQYLQRLGGQESPWTLGLALGLAGNNPGTTDSDLETSGSPTFAFRIEHQVPQSTRIGASAIVSELKYSSTNQSRHWSAGFNLFGEWTLLSKDEIHFEAFVGQNLANTGCLTLARGNDSTDLREWGAYWSGKFAVAEGLKVFGGIGYNQVINSGSVSEYTLNSIGVITATGLTDNGLIRLGLERNLTPSLQWVSELTRFQSSYKLTNAQYRSFAAYSIESGLIYRF